MVFIVNRTADIRYGVAFFVLCILLLQTQRLFEEPVCTNNKKNKESSEELSLFYHLFIVVGSSLVLAVKGAQLCTGHADSGSRRTDLRRSQTEVLIGEPCDTPSARGAADKAQLHEVWFIHILNGNSFLPNGGCQRIQPDGTAAVEFYDGFHHAAVGVVQS